MRKFILLLVLLLIVLAAGCDSERDYHCKNDPLGEACYIPPEDLNFLPSEKEEFTIDEDFENEVVGQKPENWLLFTNEEYEPGGVRAEVVQGENGKYVQMYSDGKWAPMYPQNAPNPTFIFSTKFNLDKERKGVAYGSVLLPSQELLPEGQTYNSVTIGVSTGAVNTISVTIGRDLIISVKVGGPFYYYSGNNDGGEIFKTNYSAELDKWYRFKFVWDAENDLVQAYLLTEEGDILLYSGRFHISNRYNAKADGESLVPNVFKVTMPRYQSGWAFLDDVKVERRTGQ